MHPCLSAVSALSPSFRQTSTPTVPARSLATLTGVGLFLETAAAKARLGMSQAGLTSIGFSEHGVVVSPNAPQSTDAFYIEGIRDYAILNGAVAQAAHRSADKTALIQTDMRAHINPTRMDAIANLADKMAARLETLCPTCAAPGFGQLDRKTGLPCRDCGGASTLTRAEVYGRSVCDHHEEIAHRDGLCEADPTYCLICNP